MGEGFGDCGPICLFFFLSGSQSEGAWTRSRRPVYPPNKGECIDVGSVAVGSLEAK